LLTALCVVWKRSFYVYCSPDTRVDHWDGWKFFIYYCMYFIAPCQYCFPIFPNFIVLDIQHCSLHLARSQPFSHRYSWTQHMSIRDLLSRILLPVFFHSKSGITIAKPIHRMHIGVFFLGKAACSQLLLTVYLSQDELTVLFAILCIAGTVVFTWMCPYLCTSHMLHLLLSLYPLQVGPMCMWCLWLRLTLGIRFYDIDGKSWDPVYVDIQIQMREIFV
jgi:hypothetical protein